MMPEVGFQVSYSVFSGSQLSRQLMSHSESLLILCLGIRGPCDEAAPKWPGPPGQSDRQLPVWRLVLAQTERLFLPQLDRDYSFAPTPLLPEVRISALSPC
jgi:hypothetical protein